MEIEVKGWELLSAWVEKPVLHLTLFAIVCLQIWQNIRLNRRVDREREHYRAQISSLQTILREQESRHSRELLELFKELTAFMERATTATERVSEKLDVVVHHLMK